MHTELGQDGRAHRARMLAQVRTLHRQFGVIVSSNYDISDVCNLSCEGCLYFSGLSYKQRQPGQELEEWEEFFRGEAKRGVNFGYFAGAEPSLVPDVLRQASRHIRNGVIHTNGIKRVAEDIRYRIHISVWGGVEKSEALRGASNVLRALENYAGDDRAIAVYTITGKNIDDIVPVSRLCAEYGMPVTFSYFSPTDEYLARMRGGVEGKSDYFRISSEGDNLMLGPQDFLRAHQAITEALQRYPEHVWYSLGYDRWVTQPAGLYALDGRHVATDCGNRISASHRHFNVDLTRNTGKCCSPNIDCKQCRAYAQSYATMLSRLQQFSRDESMFDLWSEVWQLWMKLFLLPSART